MVMNEFCTVVDNSIDNDPNTAVLLVFDRLLGLYNIGRNKWERLIRDRHVLERILLIGIQDVRWQLNQYGRSGLHILNMFGGRFEIPNEVRLMPTHDWRAFTAMET